MTLPASGLIDAAAINVELGRASTAAFDINGATERALAGVASGTISFSSFYGKSNAPVLDTQSVTAGGDGDPLYETQRRGYGAGLGSIADGTSNLYSGAAISFLMWREQTNDIIFRVNAVLTNSGFTTMKVGTASFNRTSATFSQTGGVTFWSWPVIYTVSTQPFGAIGSTKTVTWV